MIQKSQNGRPFRLSVANNAQYVYTRINTHTYQFLPPPLLTQQINGILVTHRDEDAWEEVGIEDNDGLHCGTVPFSSLRNLLKLYCTR